MKRILLILSLALAACQGYTPASQTPRVASYVSASPEQVYVDEYVSALDAAQAEHAAQEFEQTPQEETSVATATKHQWEDATKLWGRPPTSTSQGVTLTDENLRQRLNDALETTPLGGTAKWDAANLTFLFVPNSPVYTPHHSGGRCRDGVFAVYGDGFTDQRFRGLFCQSGPSADWIIHLK